MSWGRTDLIGKEPHHLVPPGKAYGAWTKRAPETTLSMGMKVERASRQEEREENWEAIVLSTPNSKAPDKKRRRRKKKSTEYICSNENHKEHCSDDSDDFDPV